MSEFCDNIWSFGVIVPIPGIILLYSPGYSSVVSELGDKGSEASVIVFQAIKESRSVLSSSL